MMPFYGDPSQFREAVESVRSQSDPDWRLVVIDDSYPDPRPGEWLQALRDTRIHYVRNETNLGVNGNFAKSLSLVRADYFVLMGCDDLMETGYVAGLRSAIATYAGASYFQPGVTVIDDDSAEAWPLADRVKGWYSPRVAGPVVLRGERLAVSLLRGNWTYFPAICWKADVVRRFGFSAQYEIVLDLALQLEIVLAGGSMVLLPERLFRYRRHANSVSSYSAADGTRFDEERMFFMGIAARLRQLGWRRAARVAVAHWTSRLNAVTKVPATVANRDRAGMRALRHHILSGWR
ncbi:glycosyltransferase involved in cell wall biosynthesis [Leifsonia sp. 115AMFTsu3.1]|nr:glycosyltransferase involved in cell wall biosynthesis [Leifsonia sp. 115AMFTsu3.1]